MRLWSACSHARSQSPLIYPIRNWHGTLHSAESNERFATRSEAPKTHMFSNPNCQSQYNGWSEAGLTLNVTWKRVILLQSSVSLFEGFDLAIRSHRHDQHMLLGDSHRDGDLRILPGNFVSAAWLWLVHKWLSEPALKIGFGCYARPNFAPGPAEPSTRSLRLLLAVADRKSSAICLECHPRVCFTA
jgi:hypothetical protein